MKIDSTTSSFKSSRFMSEPSPHGEENQPMVIEPWSAGPNPTLQQWAPDVSKGARLTGLDPNLLGAMVWAESRGRPETTSTNIDGTTDYGLMQVGNERWQRDIIPKLTEEQRDTIRLFSGKEPEQMLMQDPHDNVLAGSIQLLQKIHENGGDIDAGLQAYVGPNDPSYAYRVHHFQEQLAAGQVLDDAGW